MLKGLLGKVNDKRSRHSSSDSSDLESAQPVVKRINLQDFCLTQIYLDWSDEFGVAVGVVPPGPVGGAAVAAPAAGPCGHHTGGRLVPQLHGARPDDVALSGDQILLI